MEGKVEKYQVVIVGGGPVGLFLGICLEKAGISSLILEKRAEPRRGSRSLGIHPVSLELFDKLNLTNSFLKKGIKICRGHAFVNSKKLGTLSFEHCPEPFNYILSLPQHRTEKILEEELDNLNSAVLRRNTKVKNISQDENKIEVFFNENGKTRSVAASYLVGCDGKNSFVRSLANISFEGKTYADTYIMGDFVDNTDFGSDAAVFLCDDGLIESFPLLNNYRRWVVKTDTYISSVSRQEIDVRVQQRIGHDLEGTRNVMLSSFGVQKLLARPMVKNNIVLAGDAAHIVSPIGGQGMNLGWLGAWDLAQCLEEILQNDKYSDIILKGFNKRRYKAAKNAMRRAEMNMRLGRRTSNPVFRNIIVSLMLRKPFSHLMAHIFTMRGVERWII